MESCRTLKDISAVKFAVEICNDFDMKKEILCAPGSEYCLNENLNSDFDRKEHWSEILEKKTFEKLKQQRIPECVKETITGLVLLVGMKMLCWAEYHEGMFGLSRERSVDFLKSSFFTSRGIIDKKVAEELMNEESLNIEQKYRLACINCFTDQLPILFEQIPRERKKAFYNEDDPAQVCQPPLIKFWSYYLMGKIDLLKGEKTLDYYRLQNAVKSGSLAAVEYCFKLPNIREEKHILLSAASLAVRSILRGESEMYAFTLKKYDFESNVWIPKYYYTEIILFLLAKMNEIEKKNFLKTDIGCYVRWIKRYSNVLDYFLDWPYQSYFRESEKLVRDVLPRKKFSILLLKICDKIENDKKQLNYGEDKCFDYRNLLQEWLKSFGFNKKCILQDNEIYKIGFKLTLKEVKDILSNLFTLKNFTYRDHENILLILNFATYDERKNILSSDEGKNMCFELMRKERWGVLDDFLLNSSFDKDEIKKIKKDLISTENAKCIFRDFIENCKLDAIQCFINWISLPEEELIQYKEEIIFSLEGRGAFMNLIFKKGKNEGADKLLELLFSSEKIQEFKNTLLTEFDFYYCWDDVCKESCQRIENFLQWVTSSEDEIKKFKYELIYKNIKKFENYLFTCSSNWSYIVGRLVKEIRGSNLNWISVEKFLTWCLPTEKEISEFKKVLLERSGVNIHFELIRGNQWVEAETFFAWLGLNIKDIQKLKEDTIFANIGIILHILEYSEDYSNYDIDDYEFSTYGGLQDRFELLLRWCLCDRLSVMDFKSLLKEWDVRPRYFEIYSLAIEEYLSEFDTDQKAKRRKLAGLSPYYKTYKSISISKKKKYVKTENNFLLMKFNSPKGQ